MFSSLCEPARDIPIWHEADVCILGGSCTGVFAAIRAARLGAKVVLVEKANCFGGVATLSLVCVWHSLYDTQGERQIIGGLTQETIERLDKHGVLKRNKKSDPSVGFTFNPEELKIELDEMVMENGITPMLHTAFCAPFIEGGQLTAVIVENKSGRGAIRAKTFVDATGDADLAARLELETYFSSHLQPSTTCAVFSGWNTLDFDGKHYGEILRQHCAEFDLPEGFAWGAPVPGSENFMLAATRIYGANPANAEDLTRLEIEGRRQVRAIQNIFRKASTHNRLSLAALPSRAGLRESRHVRCSYQLTGDDVLYGKRFEDAIANGSYRVDIHHQDKPGITLRYLDGTETYNRPGYAAEVGRWRDETSTNPTFYQVPLRSLVPQGPFDNVVVAGRMFDADSLAHAAVRVMVNMNQTGEAAGVAAFLALDEGIGVKQVEAHKVREMLAAGGSIVI
jgi:hypothetical protein